MPETIPSTAQRRALDKALVQLEALLQQQLDAHQKLIAMLDQKRQAIRTARHDDVAQLCRLENQQVQNISELEKQRLALVAELTQLVEPAAAAPLRMGDLAERLAEPARGRLLVLRQQLVQRMTEARQRTETIQRATATLVRHMTGLMQQVTAVCSGVSTYGRPGAMQRPAMALSTFSATA